MQLAHMRAQVRAELAHIPDWPKPQQSDLRMEYWARRMHSLGKKAEGKKTAFQILLECIEDLRQYHPNFQFQYDEVLFQAVALA